MVLSVFWFSLCYGSDSLSLYVEEPLPTKSFFHCLYIINEYSLVTAVACFSFVLFLISELGVCSCMFELVL